MISAFTPDTPESLVAGLIDARRDDAYSSGYHRAINDVLALHPLLAAEFIRAHEVTSPQTRQTIRALLRYFEANLGDQSSRAISPRVEHELFGDGLGI